MPVTRLPGDGNPRRTRLLSTTRERDGYDFMRGDSKLWFEAWGTGPKPNWTTRDANGRPPSPGDLSNAEYIVFGIEDATGHVTYKTRIGGLDL